MKMFVMVMMLVMVLSSLCLSEVVNGDGLAERIRYYETLSDVGIKHSLVKRSVENARHQIKMVEVNTLGKNFKLYLQPKLSLFHPHFKAFGVNGRGDKKPIDIDVNSFFHGHVYGEPHSDVSAYWEGDALNAQIETKDDLYIIEPSWRHLPASPNYTMISYKASDMIGDVTNFQKTFCKSVKPPNLENLTLVNQQMTPSDDGTLNRQKRSFTPSKDTCPLGLTADYRFFDDMGRKSLSDTTSYLIALIERVDALYRRTAFDDIYQKFGFEIKEILVHEEPTVTTGNATHYNMLRDKWDAKEFLEYFSRGSSYRDFCMSHIFTYQSFDGGVLGLAYIGSPRTYSIGGVCSEAYYQFGYIQSLNTGWSSYKNRYGYKITAREGDLVTAHEFGHNWGSEHDVDTAECGPSSFNGGKYIMYPYSVSGYDRNNQFFSPCSKRSIAAVLSSKSDKCFVKPDPARPYCGNNLIEGSEECDAGIAGQRNTDPCCSSDCKLKFGATCSDSNSACCSLCQYAPANKVCQMAFAVDVSCQGDATCTGASAVCPKPVSKRDDSDCIDRGKCKDGQCLPFCRTVHMIPCACDHPDTSCLWCCQKDELSACEPFRYDNFSTIELPDGRPCIYGSCNKGQCERQVQEMVERFWSIIEHLTPSSFVRFMKDNIVLTVVVLSMVIWIPFSCLISYWDRKRAAEDLEQQEWMHAQNTALVTEAGKERVFIRPSSTIQRRPVAAGARVQDEEATLPPKHGYRDEVRFRPERAAGVQAAFRDDRRYVPRNQPVSYYRPQRAYPDASLARTHHPDGLDQPRWPQPGPAHYIYPDTTTTGTNV